MAEESVKVAVRVRPFNQREKDRGAKLIIQMEGQKTSIQDPDNMSEPPKSFAFDFSYWSHDGYVEQPDGYCAPSPGSKYASQQKVFDDLGAGVLKNAFEGFNCSLFAYGQTGSGKSYSMIGYGTNKGIVPITCDNLFQQIEKSDQKYEVLFSMLEIYNEQVNDLLSKTNEKGGLQVRQHPSQGYFYAQGLKQVPVGSYKEIERRIEEGTSNRTVASTNMNATSSRAHTVVTIKFDQIFNSGSGETRKSSTINLVDLAGSERADSTGATGDRLKEGANINKSLSALGNVISALADLSTNPNKKILVPYRDSVLTKLLQNALGGNSKTIMIAALSPADINFVETLSTLRYADRAKRIKTKAVVNENPIEKMIREIKEENERLKEMLKKMQSGNFQGLQMDRSASSLSKEELDAMKAKMQDEIMAQLARNQEIMQDNTTSFQERLQNAQKETALDQQESAKKEQQKNTTPYLTNLNEDPILSYVIFHFLDAPKTRLGRAKDCQINLSGLSILSEHAIFLNEKGTITLKPAEIGAKIKVNGAPIDGPVTLENNDRILFGSSHLHVFIDPRKQVNKEQRVTWEVAQKELAEARGFAVKNTSLTKEQQLIQEQIIELLPVITDVNAISEELNKYRYFEVVLVPAVAFDIDPVKSPTGSQIVMVRMVNLQNQNQWLWDKGKLMNRKFLMQDIYQKYLEGDEAILRLKQFLDPFWDPVEDLFIGVSNIFLQSLGYNMDFEDKSFITNYKGEEIGTMYSKILPCSQNGQPYDESHYIDDPSKLLKKPFDFLVSITSFDIANYEYAKGFKIKFKAMGLDYVETPVVSNSASMKFNFSTKMSYKAVTQEILQYFDTGCITYIIYAVQKDAMAKANINGLSTRELRIMRENESKEMTYKQEYKLQVADSDPNQLKLEMALLQKKYDILEDKENQLNKLCNAYAKQKMSKELQAFYNEVLKILNSKPRK